MRTIILSLVAIASLTAAVHADETWKAGDITCRAETVGDSGLELITGERGNIMSTGRHFPHASVYEWRRTVNTLLPKGAVELAHPNIDLVTPCGAARPKGA